MTERTSPAGRVAALIIGVVLTIALAEGLLRFIFPHWREFYSGWFMTPIEVPGHGLVVIGTPGFDGHFAQNNGDFRIRLRINDSGLRNDEPVAAADRRLWVIGDSMAFGWGVERDQTYTAQIARLTGQPTYNVAAPGADICGYQALAARMPDTTRPIAVIVGMVLENDLDIYDCGARAAAQRREHAVDERPPVIPLSLGGLKRRLTELSALYNFLAVAVKRVDIVQTVLTRLGLIAPAHIYKISAEADHQTELVNRTADELKNLRAQFPDIPFAVLIAPARFEIRDGDRTYAALRSALGGALAARKLDVIDPIDGFRSAGFARTHFVHDGHWSPMGHRIAAEAAAAWMTRARLAPADGKSGTQ